NYADAEELAASLSEQFGGVVAAETAEGAPPVPPTEVGPVQIWAHISTNALVITAPSRTLQNILSLVDQLDIPRAQVHLEAIIAEVSQDKAAQLGVTWIFDGSDDDNAIGLTNFGSTSPGIVQL